MGVGKSCLLHQFTEGNCKNYLKKKTISLFTYSKKKQHKKKKFDLSLCRITAYDWGRIWDKNNRSNEQKNQIANRKYQNNKKKKKISKKI